MNSTFRKPLPRSRTPDPQRYGEHSHSGLKSVSRPCSRGEIRTTCSTRLPSRVAKSENDLSVQRKSAKSKETLSWEDRLALSYNAYLQSVLMAVHDAEIRQQKEKEVISVMENQQLELMALEEEENYLDSILLKIKKFKHMKDEFQTKIRHCQEINDSIDERTLDSQIRTLEDNITGTLLKNFKLPETNEDKNAVLDLFKKISEELNKVPEIKKLIKPLNDVCSSLLKAKELNDDAEKLKKTAETKLKLAESLMYELFYLETKMNSSPNFCDLQISKESSGISSATDVS